jgi:cell division protein FtsW (lipid II flippase)
VPLPLLSYGGTSLVMNCLQIGILLNVGMRRQEY